MAENPPIKRVLMSVTDKTGVVDFARALVDEFGCEIISTGGTAGGDDLATEFVHQGAGEIDHAGLVGHRHQDALDRRIFCHGEPFYLKAESIDGKRIAQSGPSAPKTAQTSCPKGQNP